jgi:single-stranded DNA-binding protein
MLAASVRGHIVKPPVLAQSAKGLAYLKFSVEVSGIEGRFPKKIPVTVFGQRAAQLNGTLGLYQEVVVIGEPQARGFQDRTGKNAAVLEVIARDVVILGNGQAPAEPTSAVSAPQVSFGEEDIPF